MLSHDDNELLTRIGPRTPMGELMRQYWVPAALSSELPEPGGDPLRVMLLGERLIAFRDPDGLVGLVAETCPHRGASLFYARNEPGGLRCVYHGWKFDVGGRCVDLPSEPAGSNFKTKVRAWAYPCVERLGVVWAYLGSREQPPPMPALEAFEVHADDPLTDAVQALSRDCNWLQGLEGDLDTSHFGFLHAGHADPADAPDDSFMQFSIRDRAPRYKLVNRDFGATYGAYRPAQDDEHYYWRIAHFMFPFYAMVPTGVLGRKVSIRAWVPMDDQHVMMFQIGADYLQSEADADQEVGIGAISERPLLPNTSDWFGRFRPDQTRDNDHLIDRVAQRSGASFTGIQGINGEDRAITESMGPIVDRTREHLGTSDIMVIRTRRQLLAAASALRDDAVIPPGVDDPLVYRDRSGGVVLGRDEDWLAATADLRAPGPLHLELDKRIAGGA